MEVIGSSRESISIKRTSCSTMFSKSDIFKRESGKVRMVEIVEVGDMRSIL